MLVLSAALIAFAACNQPMGNNATTGNDDKAAKMKERFKAINDAFNSGKTEPIDTLLAANAVDHAEDTSMHLPKGPAGLKQMISMMREGTPDLKSDVKYMAVDGDILLAYGTMSGTNSGAMMGMPATNKHWSADFADVVKFDNNLKMTDHWGVYDSKKMMMDMGMMPPPHGAAMNQPAAPPEKNQQAAPPAKK